MKGSEIPVCGKAAVQAVFGRDPAAIKRLYFDYGTSRSVGRMTSELAKLKRIYRVVTPEELEKISGTVHHGGIVAVIDAPEMRNVTEDVVQAWTTAQARVLLLDRIGNAHNLGALARTAAFFGVEHLVLPEHPLQALPGEAAYRVAEGGLAHVTLWRVRDLSALCRALASHYDVVGTAVGPSTRSLATWTAARDRSTDRRPVALVLGNEEKGLSDEVKAACSSLVRVPGHPDRVESLNVSAAAAVLCWELWGRTPPAPPARDAGFAHKKGQPT